MKYKFNFGSEVITLPRAAAEYLRAASRDKLAVLISLAADPSMTAKKRAELLGISEEKIAEALAYWAALEVIGATSAAQKESGDAPEKKQTAKKSAAATDEKTAPAKEKSERPAALMNDTPHMTTPELTGAASNADNKRLLEHCQQLMGRVFNAAEAERVVAVRSYLGVSTDFIAAICDHLKKEGKLTVRGLENLAIELHDAGIADADALFDYFDRREKAKAFEAKVRSLYGLGARALSASEKKLLEKWAALGVDEELITYAYELTVDATGGASLKYTNAIIEKWAANGVKSVDEAKKREADFRARTESKGQKSARTQAKAKKPENDTISSFETEDFFEKALRRSYGEDFFGASRETVDPKDNGENG